MRSLCTVALTLVFALGVVPARAQGPAPLTITAAGDVGIGTPTPAFKLDVQAGQINAAGGLCIAGDCKTSWSQVTFGSGLTFTNGNLGVGTTTPAYKLDVQGGQLNAGGGLCLAGDCRTSWATQDSLWTLSGTNASYAGGSVGVGTAAPAYTLDVQGGQVNASGGLCIAGDCRTSWPGGSGPWTATGSNLSFTAGNVGIGTTSPGSPLDVMRPLADTSSDFDYGVVARIVNNHAANATGLKAGLRLRLENGINNKNGGVVLYNQAAGGADLVLIYSSAPLGGNPAEGMRINAGGNIGIGTAVPAERLHVVGNIIATGNIAAKYQDVAEWVDAAEPVDPGTVVIADPARDNHVRASGRGYDTGVAGVVSAQPGVLLGEAGAGKVAVAQSGRVRVKVDASYGPIARGDLLVTSPTPGHAMRSEAVMLGTTPIHRPGTILGKALEPLAGGQGDVLVLLTLQ